MAAEAGRLRYDGVEAYLASPLESGSNLIEFDGPLTMDGNIAVPTLSPGDYLVLTILDANYVLREIVYLNSYTEGGTTGTVDRAQEGTSVWNHGTGSKVVHSPTSLDFLQVQEHDDDPDAHKAQMEVIAAAAANSAVQAHVEEANPHDQYALKDNPVLQDPVIPAGSTLIVEAGGTLHIKEGATLKVDGTLEITSIGRLIVNGSRIIVGNTQPTSPNANTVWIQTFGG